MPFRSPKMYSFIFGFQRFVWWPKWTPASSRSFTAIEDKLPPVCSHEPNYRLLNWKRLRAPASPYFLRSLTRGSRVSRPAFFSAGPQVEVVLAQRARDAEAQRARLARDAAALGRREDVELRRPSR